MLQPIIEMLNVCGLAELATRLRVRGRGNRRRARLVELLLAYEDMATVASGAMLLASDVRYRL